MSNSRSISNGSSPSHVISIDTVQLSIEMEENAQKSPERLKSSAGQSSCCIFRVPKNLVEINQKAYQPHVVSIGPYHHGEGFKMIEEHKWRFLNELLHRTKQNVKDLIDTIAGRENEIRESYSETVKFDGKKLTEIMVLDGCFIIELFRKVGKAVNYDGDEALFMMGWVLPFIMRDFLRLENQIPYFVLETLFDSTVEVSQNGNSSLTITELALKFFNHLIHKPENSLKKFYNLQGKHLLHLILLTYIPQPPPPIRINCQQSNYLHLIPSAMKLRLSGVELKPRRNSENASLLQIQFRDGVLKIPKLMMDDFSASLVLNFVAFEQCYGHCRRHITHYCLFLCCLLGAPGDVALLSERNIIQNYFGTDEELVCFFSNMQKDLVQDIRTSYLSEVFEEVNRYCDSQWHVKWAGFKHRYCDAPWTVISVLVASLLLILTAAGTVFTGLQYWDPHQ